MDSQQLLALVRLKDSQLVLTCCKEERSPTFAVIQPANHFPLGLVPHQQVALHRPEQDRFATASEYGAKILPLFTQSVSIRGIDLLNLALVIRLLNSYQMNPSSGLGDQCMCARPIDVQVVSTVNCQLAL